MKAATFHRSKHLSADQVVDRTAECPVCLSRALRRPVHTIQTDPIIELLYCRNCRACSASHMPTAATLDAYYAAYYTGKGQRVAFTDAGKFARHILSPLRDAALGERIRILDYGGGDGSLAMAAAKRLVSRDGSRRVELLNVDYEAPAPSKDPRITVSHAKTYDQIEGLSDLVIASAILEHVPEVNPVFRKLFDSVAQGGYFYARTPYVVPFTRVFKKLDLTYPAHVHDMGSGFWNRVAEIFGFDGRYIVSCPSIVESRWLTDPVRTVAAYVLKAPSHFESMFSSGSRKDRIWNLVGGWEVVLQRSGRTVDDERRRKRRTTQT